MVRRAAHSAAAASAAASVLLLAALEPTSAGGAGRVEAAAAFAPSSRTMGGDSVGCARSVLPSPSAGGGGATTALSMAGDKKGGGGPAFFNDVAELFGSGKRGAGDADGNESSSSAALMEGTTLERRNPIPSKPNRNQQPAVPPPAAEALASASGGVEESWNGFKAAIYSAADTISTATKEPEERPPRPIDGYADAVEKPAKRLPGETPAQAVLRAIEEREAQPDWERSKMDYDAYNPSPEEVEYLGESTTAESSFFGTLEGLVGGGGSGGEEEDVPVVEEDKPKGFAAFKDSLYDTYDLLSGKKKPEKKDTAADKAPAVRPIDRISDRSASLDPNAFRPSSRPNQNANPALRLVDPSVIENLNSPNPIARAKAQYALRSAEERARKRDRDRKRRETAEKVKEAAYGFGDGIVKGATVAARAAAATPEVTREVVQTAKSIPGNVKNTVTKTVSDVKGTVDETKRITTTVYEDIVGIPSAVKTKVDETKKSIDTTKQSIEETVNKAQDTLYDAEAALGLKPKRPKPPVVAPPPPPKELTPEDIARGVAGTLLKGAGQTALWTLKGTLWLGGQGAKAVFNRATSSLRSSGKEGAAAAAEEIAGLTDSKAEVEAALKELSKVDAELGREVADALRLAEDALGKEEEKVRLAEEKVMAKNPAVEATEAVASVGAGESEVISTKASAAAARTPLEKLNIQIEAKKRREAGAGAAATSKPRAMFFTDEGSSRQREISEAVRKAREAAERAARDAAELEAMLKEDDEESDASTK